LRILRDYREKPGLLAPLADFNQRLAETGAQLIYYRASFVTKLFAHARAVHSECSGGAEELNLTYTTVRGAETSQPERAQILAALLTRQAELYDAELAAGQCLVGAHKDDLEIAINGIAARAFASQGQARTAALSLKLAERDMMREDSGRPPLLLLDDVLSELDATRRAFVLGRIGGGQTFITSCEPIDADAMRGASVLTVDSGELTEEERLC
ncbi:MAG: DNA replication and repair protein RecF, partial [Oscillospiraceae bacterium]|nr:DNA replication and repair protein RecF [Oscillospiraceae bacterium]